MPNNDVPPSLRTDLIPRRTDRRDPVVSSEPRCLESSRTWKKKDETPSTSRATTAMAGTLLRDCEPPSRPPQTTPTALARSWDSVVPSARAPPVLESRIHPVLFITLAIFVREREQDDGYNYVMSVIVWTSWGRKRIMARSLVRSLLTIRFYFASECVKTLTETRVRPL